ncbi:GAF domain-containing sensor histidine kinase [Halalkalibacterium halodurans]|uniref:GAF domain-containing sensor histidine kinase n=1 Tax=Halalkalibacterium halodurans TaxID=86665 RepID=UPI002E20D4A6|nr:GAF domain-containing sensor histidine kinase [Halalkalibacterium halodurans]
MAVISLLGFLAVMTSLFAFEINDHFMIFFLLVVFLGVTEFYPFPVWRGYTTLSFPIIFTIDLVYGLEVMVVVYALVVLLINVIQKRPLRVVCFNPAQLVLSYLAAKGLMWFVFAVSPVLHELTISSFLIEIILVTSFFYIMNNSIVDLVLLIRPQPYPFVLWKKKSVSEAISFFFSLVYVILLYFLGGQNRGIIDAFSFFFFFSPLIGLALLGASNSRLRKEKNRLKALFLMTKRINKRLTSKNWIQSLQHGIEELLDVEATILWIKEEGEWKSALLEGRINKKNQLDPNDLELDSIVKPTIFPDHRKETSPADAFFEKGLKASVYAPLYIEKELVGMLIVARSRTHSFNEEDSQLINALANQLAVVVKTRLLISEQEKRVVLEERNRIAREIHDGIAQTLAGGIMKLETVKRTWETDPTRSLGTIEDSLEKLRHSLKEVREVIYALRPYPTEHVSLKQAIHKRISILEEEHQVLISFEVRGKPVILDNEVEKVMFDTLQESLQNVIKHADATRVEVLLSYQAEHVLLKIKDDGEGFSLMDAMIKARDGSHFGIISMNEEAKRIEASLQIESSPGNGTVIMLQVPKY